MTEPKHSGPESYMNNPGVVSKDAQPIEEKDEHAPDPKTPRRPVISAPAIPVEGRRVHPGYFGGELTPMSPEAVAAKFPETKDDDGSAPTQE